MMWVFCPYAGGPKQNTIIYGEAGMFDFDLVAPHARESAGKIRI
jgi:hypothetical protein